MSALTAPTTEPQAESPFCDCARDGDRWLCRSRTARGPGSCEPGTGRTCALAATVAATGRDNWNRVNIKDLKPCACG